jgi:hypothetical protein
MILLLFSIQSTIATLHQISLDVSGTTLVVVKATDSTSREVLLSGSTSTLDSIFVSANTGKLVGCAAADNEGAKLFGKCVARGHAANSTEDRLYCVFSCERVHWQHCARTND